MTVRKLKAAIAAHYEGFILVVVLAGTLAISFLVRYRISFLNFFFLPVILAGYSLGKRKGVLVATLSILLVAFDLVFQEKILGGGPRLTFDEILTIVTWGGFLILTGALLGSIAEQKEARLRTLQRSHVAILSVLLKYLEVADEEEPRSVRVSRLAGRMAERAGLGTDEVENIKSAALFCDVGESGSSLPLIADAAGYMEAERVEGGLSDRDRVLLKTTASLLREIGPLMEGYYAHYVRDAETLDKDFDRVPFGSSLIALACVHDRIIAQGGARLGPLEIRSPRDLEALKGRAFSERALKALADATS